MIPLLLRPENFLSYGEDRPYLDFTTFDVVCLSGRNGAGKSALLDALTWAVWAKARGDNDQLVRRGAFRMSVEFVFETSDGVYRIIRAYDKSNKRHEAYLHRRDRNGYVPVAEKPREVEARLKSIIGLDHDVFLASSYLKQGDADHFVRLKKSKRKEALYEILGLNRILKLGDAAKESSAAIAVELGVVARELEALDREISTEPEAKVRYAAAKKAYKEAQKRVEKARRSLDEARARADRFKAVSDLAKAENQKSRALRTDLQGAEKAVEKYAAEAARVQTVISKKDEVVLAYEEYKAATERLKELDGMFRELKDLENQRGKVEEVAAERRKSAEKKHSAKTAEARAVRERLAEVEKTLKERERITAGYEGYKRAAAVVSDLEKKAVEDRKLEREVAEARGALNNRVTELETRLKGVAERLEEVGDTAGAVARAEAELSRVSAALAKAEGRRERLDRLSHETERVSRLIEGAGARAEEAAAAASALETRIAELSSARVTKCPTCEREFDAASRAAAVRTLEREMTEELAHQADAEAEAAELAARVRKLSAEGAELARKKPREAADGLRAELGHIRTELESARANDEGRKKLARREADLRKTLEEEKTAGKYIKRLVELERERVDLGFDARSLEKARARELELREFEGLRRELEKAGKEARDLKEKAVGLRAELAELERELAGDFLTESERKKIAELWAKAEAVGYDPRERESLEKELKKLSGVPERYEELLRAEAALGGFLESERLARENVDRLRTEVDGLERTLEDRTRELKELAGAREDLARAQAQFNDAEDLALKARDESGAAGARLEALEAARERRKELKASAGVKEKEKKIYEYLRKAFGRDGIPLRMLDRGLAELEEVSNELLARLTDGRLTMTLETEAPKKSGEGTMDTLEVKVADGGALRSYELLSGGEAFRCDFALRVGLAKLLSRRVGVPLRFLILDEGFGTQDPDGLDALVECINAITAEFKKILVISHLPELRDRFGTRIEVTKDANGLSRYEVIS